MKQFLSVLLVLMLFIMSVAVAEGIDVSTLTDSELLSLKEAVDKEVEARGVNGGSEIKPWYDYGLGQYVPDPATVFGHDVKTEDVLKHNSDTMFIDKIEGITREEFNLYSEATKAMGFTRIIETSGNWWEATRDDGIKVRLVYLGDNLNVDVDPAE